MLPRIVIFDGSVVVEIMVFEKRCKEVGDIIEKSQSVGLDHIAQMHYFFDSAFPAGSYGHSFGFETFATSNLGGQIDRALEWIRTYMVFSLWYGDLENISKVRGALNSPIDGLDKARHLDKRLHVSRSTIEGRRSAQTLSKSMATAAAHLFRDRVTPEGIYSGQYLEPSTFVAHLSHLLDWNESYLRLFYLQGQALAATSVLVRCGKIGQFAQLKMMAELIQVSSKLACARPNKITSRGAVTNWAIEVDQIDHQSLSPRLFQS
ncbi:MAG: hypothetical protein M0Z45_11115 [Actinomycetota bacterium]|nr:hypothetical protein [Actinomycetota bacterium]